MFLEIRCAQIQFSVIHVSRGNQRWRARWGLYMSGMFKKL